MFLKHAEKLRVLAKDEENSDEILDVIDYQEEYSEKIAKIQKSKLASLHLQIRLTITEKSINIEEILKSLEFLNEFISLLSRTRHKSRLRSCAYFSFLSESYRLGGGLPLPASLNYASDRFKSVGKPTISGLTISFDDSIIGVESVEIAAGDKFVRVDVNLGYREKPSSDFFDKAFTHATATAELFVDKKV